MAWANPRLLVYALVFLFAARLLLGFAVCSNIAHGMQPKWKTAGA